MLTKEEEEVISKEVSRIQKKLVHPETNDEKVRLSQFHYSAGFMELTYRPPTHRKS